MYIDRATDVEDSPVIKELFDNMREGALAMVAQGKPRIVNEGDSPVDGHPGRFLQIELTDNTVLRAKYIAVRNRIYGLVATSGKAQSSVMGSESDYKEIAMAFLNSFQLTK